jgi:hypothetical protein
MPSPVPLAENLEAAGYAALTIGSLIALIIYAQLIAYR